MSKNPYYAIEMKVTRNANGQKHGRGIARKAAVYFLSEPTMGYNHEYERVRPLVWVWGSAVLLEDGQELCAFFEILNQKRSVISDHYVTSNDELSLSMMESESPAEAFAFSGYIVIEPTEMMFDALVNEDMELLAVAGDDAEERGMFDHAEACRQIIKGNTLINMTGLEYNQQQRQKRNAA